MSPIEGHARWTKEERSDRRHCSGDLLQPIKEEDASTGYGGSDAADGSRTCDRYGGSVAMVVQL
mgnify:CR=1 FL=1